MAQTQQMKDFTVGERFYIYGTQGRLICGNRAADDTQTLSLPLTRPVHRS
ncbi:MAG: hypothetical protein LBK65_09385 [Tannerellaceae bacterium]|nr:hypothetical protein [Tannerellaceae bacterium]